jgi:hypothetical protein
MGRGEGERLVRIAARKATDVVAIGAWLYWQLAVSTLRIRRLG